MTDHLDCDFCKGSGHHPTRSGPFVKVECPECNGSGKMTDAGLSFSYTCGCCGKNGSRKLVSDAAPNEKEKSCAHCKMLVCPDCMEKNDGKDLCPRCRSELLDAVL